MIFPKSYIFFRPCQLSRLVCPNGISPVPIRTSDDSGAQGQAVNAGLSLLGDTPENVLAVSRWENARQSASYCQLRRVNFLPQDAFILWGKMT